MKKIDNKILNETAAVVHKAATVIMEKRQEGIAMRDMLNVFSPADVYLKSIVANAYVVQRFESKTVQQAVTKEFADIIVSDYWKRLS